MWETKKLGDVIRLEYGKPLQQNKRSEAGPYPVYGANGIKSYSDEFYHDKRSIIVGRKGSAGEINLTENRFWPLDVTYFVTFDEHKYDLMFLYHCLVSLQLTRLAKGVKPGINRNDVYQLEFAYPPLPEQKRIVAVLDEAFAGIDTAIANTENNLSNAREIFDSYLNDVFTRGEINWVKKSLGEVCLNITDGKHGDCKNDPGSGYYFLSARDVRNETLNYEKAREIVVEEFEETHRRTDLEPGDILVTNAGTIGRTAIAPNDEKTYKTTFQKSVAVLKPIHGVIDSEFCLFGLKASLAELVNLSSGVAQKNLLLRDLRSFEIKMPLEISQQKEISTNISLIMNETQSLQTIYQQKLDALVELKQSILEKAFAGELTQAKVAA